MARYVVDVVESLDLSAIEQTYSGRGSVAFHPKMLLALLIHAYATGLFSSRKIELATCDSLAFRYIACNLHPDHDTLNSFRQRLGVTLDELFVQVLVVAREQAEYEAKMAARQAKEEATGDSSKVTTPKPRWTPSRC